MAEARASCLNGCSRCGSDGSKQLGLVVAGFEPYAEQTWSRVRIGSVDFEVAGPCVRCQLTTRHPQTGFRRDDGEPAPKRRGARTRRR